MSGISGDIFSQVGMEKERSIDGKIRLLDNAKTIPHLKILYANAKESFRQHSQNYIDKYLSSLDRLYIEVEAKLNSKLITEVSRLRNR